MRLIAALLLCVLVSAPVSAREYHVSVEGDDGGDGSAGRPLRTLNAAAALAQPGDTVTVHAGVYREQVSPPRGGTSDAARIVYQAAGDGEVVITGAEVVRSWERVEGDTWKVVLPNSLFGDFNPYADLIAGDWFAPQGREHHTGAVYVDGHWLIEASELADVLAPVGAAAGRYAPSGQGTLLNVAWFRPEGGAVVPGNSFAAQQGVQTAPCTEGGECVGWIEQGDWMRYADVDFGAGAERIEIRTASATLGGVIEIRLGDAKGELLGTCEVPNTGGWQSWVSYTPEIPRLTGKQTLCFTFRAKGTNDAVVPLWFGQVDDEDTTLWAQFPQGDPNGGNVEINVRRAVFYPEQTGINYLTVRGFHLTKAATNWAPPTAEQVGLIGTNWSKGWVIEGNVIDYATCVGVTLGKHGDEFDNTSANTAEGYVKTIERGLARGWSKENIGSHVVRDNIIAHCEQAGLVGSLGAAFSTITGNDIHDIHVRRLFSGAEMAGIKIHAAIDTRIEGNRIYRTCRAIWLDWMAQGTRVTGNLLYDTAPWEDLFVEVNHGPFLVDNNLFLSDTALFSMSQGGAYVHNLFTGRLAMHPEPNRETPYHPAHSTAVAGLSRIQGGDDRFYNNLFVGGSGLAAWDNAGRPVFAGGNVYLGGAAPCQAEEEPVVLPDADPGLLLNTRVRSAFLPLVSRLGFPAEVGEARTVLVDTALLGKAAVPGVPWENPDGTPLAVTEDYFGQPRDAARPTPGPFEALGTQPLELRVWPVRTP